MVELDIFKDMLHCNFQNYRHSRSTDAHSYGDES